MDNQKQNTSSQQLFKLLGSYKWTVISLCLLATLSVVLTFSPHVFVWWLAVELFEGVGLPDPKTLLFACLLLAAALMMRYILAGIASMGSHFVAFQVQKDLRQKLSEKLASISMGYLESQQRGSLRKLAVDDVEGLEDGLAHLIPEAVASIINPLLLITAMFIMDWRMALFAIFPIFGSFFLLGHLMKRGEDATRNYQNGLSEIGAVAQETVSAFPLVKTHGASSIVLGRAAKAFKKFRDETDAWIRKALLPSIWFQVFTTAAPAVVLPAGVYLYQTGSIDIATLLFFLITSIGMGNMFATLGSLSHRLNNQKDILNRIFLILNEKELPVQAAPEPIHMDGIKFENVSFSYGEQTVLKDINLEIKAGESIALVGPSGSGKSTITRLLSRFQDVNEGRILIGDVDIRAVSPDDLNKNISHVFQDVFLFSQSISDNIKLGCADASEEDIIAAAKAAQAHEFIMELPDGYETALSENGRNFSGGERQRISIARAILKNAPLLLLDEATAYADPKNELQVQLAISELTRNKTVIAIAHRLNTIVDMDRIIVLDNGKILDQGQHETLLERCELYRNLWQANLASHSFSFNRSSVAGDAKPQPIKQEGG